MYLDPEIVANLQKYRTQDLGYDGEGYYVRETQSPHVPEPKSLLVPGEILIFLTYNPCPTYEALGVPFGLEGIRTPKFLAHVVGETPIKTLALHTLHKAHNVRMGKEGKKGKGRLRFKFDPGREGTVAIPTDDEIEACSNAVSLIVQSYKDGDPNTPYLIKSELQPVLVEGLVLYEDVMGPWHDFVHDLHIEAGVRDKYGEPMSYMDSHGAWRRHTVGDKEHPKIKARLKARKLQCQLSSDVESFLDGVVQGQS